MRKIVFLNFIFNYIFTWECTWEYSASGGQKRTLNSIAGVTSDWELLTVMLETKLRSAAKTANILNR